MSRNKYLAADTLHHEGVFKAVQGCPFKEPEHCPFYNEASGEHTHGSYYKSPMSTLGLDFRKGAQQRKRTEGPECTGVSLPPRPKTAAAATSVPSTSVSTQTSFAEGPARDEWLQLELGAIRQRLFEVEKNVGTLQGERTRITEGTGPAPSASSLPPATPMHSAAVSSPSTPVSGQRPSTASPTLGRYRPEPQNSAFSSSASRCADTTPEMERFFRHLLLLDERSREDTVRLNQQIGTIFNQLASMNSEAQRHVGQSAKTTELQTVAKQLDNLQEGQNQHTDRHLSADNARVDLEAKLRDLERQLAAIPKDRNTVELAKLTGLERSLEELHFIRNRQRLKREDGRKRGYQLEEARKAIEDAVSRLPTIDFGKNEANLDSEDVAALNAVAEILHQYPSANIKVIGMTTSMKMVPLAQKRSQVCADYVVAKGIEASRLVPEARHGPQKATIFEPFGHEDVPDEEDSVNAVEFKNLVDRVDILEEDLQNAIKQNQKPQQGRRR